MNKAMALAIVEEVVQERERQAERRPLMDDHDPLCWLAILTDYTGKAAAAMWNGTRWTLGEPGVEPRRMKGWSADDLQEYRKRLVQVAAVAVAAVEALDRDEWIWKPEQRKGL